MTSTQGVASGMLTKSGLLKTDCLLRQEDHGSPGESPSRLIFSSRPISKSSNMTPSSHEDPLLQLLDESRAAAAQNPVSLPIAAIPTKSTMSNEQQLTRGVKRPRKQTRPAIAHSPMTQANKISFGESTKVKSSLQTNNIFAKAGRQVPEAITSSKPSKPSTVLISGARDLPSEQTGQQDHGGSTADVHDELACHADNIMRMAVDSTMFASSFNTSCSNTFANDLCLDHDDFLNFLNEDYESDRSVLEYRASRRRGLTSLAKSNAKRIEISAEELTAAIS